MIRRLFSLFRRDGPPQPFFSIGRAPGWPKLRDAHIAAFPTCSACGTAKDPEVHHVVPVHVSPGAELDPANLQTLCGSKANNCHFRIGHAMNWRGSNRFSRDDAAVFLTRVQESLRLAKK